MAVGTRGVSPGLLYTAGRVACFVVVAAILYMLGFRRWILVLGALVLSAPLSFIVLRQVRIMWSSQIDERLAKRREQKKRLRATLRGDD